MKTLGNRVKTLGDKKRATASMRGYGSDWRKARAEYLRANPICRYCDEKGCVVAATVVDHIVPHQGNAKLFWAVTNWQPLCKHCHDSVKAKQEYADGYR